MQWVAGAIVIASMYFARSVLVPIILAIGLCCAPDAARNVPSRLSRRFQSWRRERDLHRRTLCTANRIEALAEQVRSAFPKLPVIVGVAVDEMTARAQSEPRAEGGHSAGITDTCLSTLSELRTALIH